MYDFLPSVKHKGRFFKEHCGPINIYFHHVDKKKKNISQYVFFYAPQKIDVQFWNYMRLNNIFIIRMKLIYSHTNKYHNNVLDSFRRLELL